MAEKYLGAVAQSSDFKIQELIRTIDATLGDVNPSGLPTGQNCLSIIKFISSFENFDKFVTPGFKQVISDEINKSSGKQNVREHVKTILMFPRNSYLPWLELKVNADIIDDIKNSTKDIKFKLEIVEGKVYGLCISDKKITQIVFDKVNHMIPELRLNSETAHITIVNSNIVADIGQDKVNSFLKTFNEEFTVNTNKIKSTFSEDWSRFGECYVIELDCPYIDNFIVHFNKEFNKTVKITKHTTFAIKPRSLF